jgi:hypothetical protein
MEEIVKRESGGRQMKPAATGFRPRISVRLKVASGAYAGVILAMPVEGNRSEQIDHNRKQHQRPK